MFEDKKTAPCGSGFSWGVEDGIRTHGPRNHNPVL